MYFPQKKSRSLLLLLSGKLLKPCCHEDRIGYGQGNYFCISATYCFLQHMEQELTSKSPLQHSSNLKDQEHGG